MVLKSRTEISEIRQIDIADIIEIAKETNLSEWNYDSYLNEISNPDSIFLCIKYMGKNIGFALARLIMLQNSHLNISNEAELLNIGIRKFMQRNGFGQIIFDFIINRCEQSNIKIIWLEARKSNIEALSFYKKNGFSIEFERKNYYTEPIENALVMKKRL